MAKGITRFRRKPDPKAHDDQLAARYTPGDPEAFMACLRVAQMADGASQLAEVEFADGQVLLVRYRRFYDYHPSEIDYQAVEPGQWLAYSGGEGFLYDTDDGDWKQFYDVVDQEPSPADT